MSENKWVENRNVISDKKRLSFDACINSLKKECHNIKELEDKLRWLNLLENFAVVCILFGAFNLRDGFNSTRKIFETLLLGGIAVAIGVYAPERENIEKIIKFFYKNKLKNELEIIFGLLKKLDSDGSFKLIENYFDDLSGQPKESLGWTLSRLGEKSKVKKLISELQEKYLKNLNPFENIERNSINTPRSDPMLYSDYMLTIERMLELDKKNIFRNNIKSHEKNDKILFSKIMECNEEYNRQNSFFRNLFIPFLSYTSTLLGTKFALSPFLDATPLGSYPELSSFAKIFIMMASGSIIPGKNFIDTNKNNGLIIKEITYNFKKLSFFKERSEENATKESLSELIDYFSIKYKNNNDKINIFSEFKLKQENSCVKDCYALEMASDLICSEINRMIKEYEYPECMTSDEKLNSTENRILPVAPHLICKNQENPIEKSFVNLSDNLQNRQVVTENKSTKSDNKKNKEIEKESEGNYESDDKIKLKLKSNFVSKEETNLVNLESKEKKIKNKKKINKKITKPIEKESELEFKVKSHNNEKHKSSYLWDVSERKLTNKIKNKIKNGELVIAKQLIKNIEYAHHINELILFVSKRYDFLQKKQIDVDKIRNFQSFLLNASSKLCKISTDKVSDALDENKPYKINIPKPPGSRISDIARTKQNNPQLSEVIFENKESSLSPAAIDTEASLSSVAIDAEIFPSHGTINIEASLSPVAIDITTEAEMIEIKEVKTRQDIDPLFKLQYFLEKKIKERMDFNGIKEAIKFYYPRDFLLLSLEIQMELTNIFKDKYQKEPVFYIHGGLPRNLFCTLDSQTKKNKNDADFVTSLSVGELIYVLSELKKKYQDVSYEVCYQSDEQSLVKVENFRDIQVDFLCYPDLSLENFPRPDYNFNGLILSFNTMEIYDPAGKIECLIDGALGIFTPAFTVEKGCLSKHNIRDLIPMWEAIINQLKEEEGFDKIEFEQICKSWIDDYTRIFRLLEKIEGEKLINKNQLTKTMRLCYEDSILSQPFFSLILAACNQKHHLKKDKSHLEIKHKKPSIPLVDSAAFYFDKIVCKLLKKGEENFYQVTAYKRRLIWLMEESCSDKDLRKKISEAFEFLGSNDEYANKIKGFLKAQYLNENRNSLGDRILLWAVGIMLVNNPEKQRIMSSKEEFTKKILEITEKIPFFMKFVLKIWNNKNFSYSRVLDLKNQIGQIHEMLNKQEKSYTLPLDQKNKNPHCRDAGKLSQFWEESAKNNSLIPARGKENNPVFLGLQN